MATATDWFEAVATRTRSVALGELLHDRAAAQLPEVGKLCSEFLVAVLPRGTA